MDGKSLLGKAGLYIGALASLILMGCSESLGGGGGGSSNGAQTIISALSSGNISSTSTIYVNQTFPYNPTGGTPPYTFSVNAGCVSTIGISTGLFQAGANPETCTITITDAKSAKITAIMQVVKPPVPLTYAWTQSGFGTCSATCGGGTQTQTVGCQASNGTTVSNSFCTGTPPASSQSCNTQACGGNLYAQTQVSGPINYPPLLPAGYSWCDAGNPSAGVAGATCAPLGSTCIEVTGTAWSYQLYETYECLAN